MPNENQRDYTLSVHTMHPDFQCHVSVPSSADTFSYHEPNEEYHRYHPFVAHLHRGDPELKLFVRVAPAGALLGANPNPNRNPNRNCNPNPGRC